MTARAAVRQVRSRLCRIRPETAAGFGPIVGTLPDFDAWRPPHPRLDRAPLDYAVGCVDPIEEEPQRMVAPASLRICEWILLGSILALGALALLYVVGGK